MLRSDLSQHQLVKLTDAADATEIVIVKHDLELLFHCHHILDDIQAHFRPPQ
jgi:hypothetical protein